MLDSNTIHSFVHPRVVKLMGVEPTQGAALTVAVANGNQVLHHDIGLSWIIIKLDLSFSVEGGDRQVIVHSHLYVPEGL